MKALQCYKVIYHSRSTDYNERIRILLDDADKLIENCGGLFQDLTEYQLFVRCLSEQTLVTGYQFESNNTRTQRL